MSFLEQGMAKDREEKMAEMVLSALSRTVIFRVGKPGSPTTPDVAQSMSEGSCPLGRLDVVRRGLVLVRQLRDMDNFHSKVQRLGRAGIRRFRPRGVHQNSPFRG